VGGPVYAQAKNQLYVNLFAAGEALLTMDDGLQVKLIQETNYPWNGQTQLTVTPARTSLFGLCLRVPG